MNQNNLNGRIGLYGMTTVVLGYMLIDVVKAFIIGGEGARISGCCWHPCWSWAAALPLAV